MAIERPRGPWPPEVRQKVANKFEGVDWEGLWKRLVVAARFATAWAPDIFDGISAEDLAGETLRLFLSSSDQLGWKPAKGPLDKYLVGRLKKKALERLRRERRTAGSFDDPDSRLPELADPKDLASGIQFRSLSERLDEAVGDDKELRDLIAAAEFTTGAHNVNQELAAILCCSPRQVVNLKRRMLSLPGVREVINGERRPAETER